MEREREGEGERERDALKLQTCTVVLGAARVLSALLSCNVNGSFCLESWNFGLTMLRSHLEDSSK